MILENFNICGLLAAVGAKIMLDECRLDGCEIVNENEWSWLFEMEVDYEHW